MPAFLNANNLQPYVGADLNGALELIEYKDLSRNRITGYSSEILPLLCKVYLIEIIFAHVFIILYFYLIK